MSRYAKALGALGALTKPVALSVVVMPLLVGVALADDPCSGTICDLMGKSRAAAPATQTPGASPSYATPVAVPSSGGILNFFRGNSSDQSAAGTQTTAPKTLQVVGGHPADEPCTGTICDLVHGTSGKAKPAATAATASSATVPVLPPPGPMATQQARNVDYIEPVREAKQCHNASDPWHCYRK